MTATLRRVKGPLRGYLSYPMTLATPDDQRIIDDLRCRLIGWTNLISLYDPDKDEDKQKTLWEIQNDDFRQLMNADLLIATITPGTKNSKGECAEIEWAVRVFNSPIFVWNPRCIQLPPWVDATLQNGRADYFFTFADLYNALVTLRNII